jgi:hypothetical protein
LSWFTIKTTKSGVAPLHFVAGLLDNRDGFSLRDFFTFVALRRFNPDLAHRAGSLFQRWSQLDRLLSSSYADAIIGLIAPAFKQFA